MENQREEQPKPPEMTPTQALGIMVQALQQSLMREAQANNGQMDMGTLMTNVQMLVEHAQMVTALLIELAPDKINDDIVTTLLAARIKNNIAERDKLLGERRLVQAVRGVDPRRLNGSGSGPRR